VWEEGRVCEKEGKKEKGGSSLEMGRDQKNRAEHVKKWRGERKEVKKW